MTDIWGETSVQVKNRGQASEPECVQNKLQICDIFCYCHSSHSLFNMAVSSYWCQILNRYDPRIDMKKTSQKVRYEQQFGAEHEGLTCECGLFTTSVTVLMLVGY